MRKKFLISLALLLVIPGLLFTVSCAKKAVKTDDSAVTEPAPQPAPEPAPQAKSDTDADAEAAMAARNMFQYEDLFFDYDSSELLSLAQEVLKRKAEWLLNNGGESAVIEGHCDERGSEEYNIALGDRRAESAKSFLIDLGIGATRMSTKTYGESRPVDPGHNEEAWAKNRRAHFVIE